MKRLLIADDDSVILRNTARYLEAAGWDVVTACDGRQALELMDVSIDAVVLDRKMPSLGGDETLLAIRTQRQYDHVCVILLTGFGEVNSAVKAMRLGAYQYLQKPFDLEDLERLLNSGLVWQRARSIRRRLLGVFDTDRLLRLIADLLAETLNPHGLYFTFLTADGSVSQVIDASRLATTDASLLSPHFSNRLFVKEILHKKHPIHANDSEGTTKLNPMLQSAQDLLAVPVFGSEGRLAGIIHVESLSADTFDSGWEDVLEYLADIEGLSLELDREAKTRAKEAELLASRKLRAFVRELAHRVMSPVRGIQFRSDQAKAEIPRVTVDASNVTGLERQLDEISRSALSIERIVEHLRDVSDDLVLSPSEFDVNALAFECAEEIRKEVEAKGIKLMVSQRPVHCVVIADRGLIKYSLRCLLRNAVEAIERYRNSTDSAENEDEIVLSVKANEVGDQILIAVSDTGPGVPRDDEAKLFSPLFTTKTRPILDREITLNVPGTFGLYNVARVMEMHGGDVTFANRDGHGSVFVLRLRNNAVVREAVSFAVVE